MEDGSVSVVVVVVEANMNGGRDFGGLKKAVADMCKGCFSGGGSVEGCLVVKRFPKKDGKVMVGLDDLVVGLGVVVLVVAGGVASGS